MHKKEDIFNCEITQNTDQLIQGLQQLGVYILNHQIYTYLIIYLFFIKEQKRKQMNLQNLKQYSFYYKGSKIQLTFAQGTTQTQIIETLKIVFKIGESKKLLFMGDDGKLIVLSSKLPNQTKLTVIDGDYQFAGFTKLNGQQSSWIWKKPENSKFINDKSFETFGDCKLVVYGNIKMKKPGKYWWRVQINQIWCCQELGITSESLQQGFWLSKPEQYNKTIGFPSKFPGETTGPGDTGCHHLNWNNHIFYCCLNFKDNTFKIVNETIKKTIQDVKVVFEEAIPYYMSNKHPNIITLLETGYEN